MTRNFSRRPHDLIETFQTAVQAVRAVVLRQLVLSTVQRKSPFRDSIAVAANQCAEKGIVPQVAVEMVKPQDDVRHCSMPVGREN